MSDTVDHLKNAGNVVINSVGQAVTHTGQNVVNTAVTAPVEILDAATGTPDDLGQTFFAILHKVAFDIPGKIIGGTIGAVGNAALDGGVKVTTEVVKAGGSAVIEGTSAILSSASETSAPLPTGLYPNRIIYRPGTGAGT